MWRRFLVAGSVVVVVVAGVMVVRAAGSPDGLAGALGVWGFVLAAVGVVLAAVALWPAAREGGSSRTNVQVVRSERGDAFGVQNGNQYVKRGDDR
jgi:hypothetical protein